MGLFEFCSRIVHRARKTGWTETNAVFTGKFEKAARGKAGHYIPADYSEYQIRFDTAEGEQYGWYVFYPLPDPDPETIKNTSIRIRYRENRPWIYEAIGEQN